MAGKLQGIVRSFLDEVSRGNFEIYNEFSLQHEIGCFIRDAFAKLKLPFKVQFERPSEFFGISKNKLEKKEIDIVIFNEAERAAIELKFPRNGQYPEQMFKACQDIRFLEQLCDLGFDLGIFLMVVDDSGFYSSHKQSTEGIYSYFRKARPLRGTIRKPTGKKDKTITLRGEYQITWYSLGGIENKRQLKYALVSVLPNKTKSN